VITTPSNTGNKKRIHFIKKKVAYRTFNIEYVFLQWLNLTHLTSLNNKINACFSIKGLNEAE